MNRKYFGTDGVRGRVGQVPITPDFVMRLGYAAGKALLGQAVMPEGERPSVLIGKDTRLSGYMLESALEAGFSAAGVDVCLVGPMPTPAVAYLTRALRLQAGIVISASHNPYFDNGIKFFSGQGTKLPDDVELTIEAGIDQPMVCVAAADLGRAKRIDDARGRYIEFCKSTFPNDLDLRGLKLVVDCANGAAWDIAPHVFRELGATVVAVGNQPNGTNINHECGSMHPQNLCAKVREYRADLGIAHGLGDPRADETAHRGGFGKPTHRSRPGPGHHRGPGNGAEVGPHEIRAGVAIVGPTREGERVGACRDIRTNRLRLRFCRTHLIPEPFAWVVGGGLRLSRLKQIVGCIEETPG